MDTFYVADSMLIDTYLGSTLYTEQIFLDVMLLKFGRGVPFFSVTWIPTTPLHSCISSFTGLVALSSSTSISSASKLNTTLSI